jgi:hypothetical protein
MFTKCITSITLHELVARRNETTTESDLNMNSTNIPAHGWGFIALVTLLLPPVGIVAAVCKLIRKPKGSKS